MRVSDVELLTRRALLQLPKPAYARGYGRLFLEHIRQAHEGCDFDFLEGTAAIDEPKIH